MSYPKGDFDIRPRLSRAGLSAHGRAVLEDHRSGTRASADQVSEANGRCAAQPDKARQRVRSTFLVARVPLIYRTGMYGIPVG